MLLTDMQGNQGSIGRALWARRWHGVLVAWAVAIGLAAMLMRRPEWVTGLSRPTAFGLVLPLALLAGLLATYVSSVLRPTVDDVDDLRALTGRPVLGGVSRLLDARSGSSQRASEARFPLALVGLVLAYGVWFAVMVNTRPS